MHDISSDIAINVIYTGVAGTGKTYRLLQIAKQYTDYLPVADNEALLAHFLQPLSWREVICLVFLDLQKAQQDLVKVPEIVAHEFFIIKAAQNARAKNLSNTVWSVLQTHSPVASKTVSSDNRASQAYFDKDESSAWYLLADSLPLLSALREQLLELRQAQRDNQPEHNQTFSNQRFSMVSFHQAYGYEEFVEGIRPVLSATAQNSQSQQNLQTNKTNQNSQMHYAIQDGAFLKLCQRAANDPKQRYAMLIDEINRANVSRVFGELLSLIESDKRSGQTQAMQVSLAYSGRTFSVPSNVDIYATMNTQDHSLAPLDMALRRRFRFIDCPPQAELLSTIEVFETIENQSSENNPPVTIDLAKILTGLNWRIMQSLGQEAQLGHAFLFSVSNLSQLQTALVEQIIPQLIQATGGQLALLQYLFNDEAHPFAAQFIQDVPLTDKQNSNQQQDRLNQNQMFNNHNSFLGQSMGASNYRVNPDLIARVSEFAQPIVYQRLY